MPINQDLLLYSKMVSWFNSFASKLIPIFYLCDKTWVQMFYFWSKFSSKTVTSEDYCSTIFYYNHLISVLCPLTNLANTTSKTLKALIQNQCVFTEAANRYWFTSHQCLLPIWDTKNMLIFHVWPRHWCCKTVILKHVGSLILQFLY